VNNRPFRSDLAPTSLSPFFASLRGTSAALALGLATVCGVPQLRQAAAQGIPSTALPSNNAVAAALVTNATPGQIRAIEAGLESLNRLVQARDTTTLGQLGVNLPATAILATRIRLQGAAVTSAGALVRVNVAIWSAPDASAAPKLQGESLLDVWMRRTNGVTGGELAGLGEQFILTDRRWTPPGDAVEPLANSAVEEWKMSFGPNAPRLDAEAKATRTGELLHLVAQKRGGRWIALRRSRWDGNIAEAAMLARMEREANSLTTPSPSAPVGQNDIRPWLRRQLKRFDSSGIGTAHVVLQKGSTGWVGLESVWEPDKHTSVEVDRVGVRWRQAMGNGSPLTTNWLAAMGHRDYALSLSQLGLFGEAADEADKAELLQPGIIGATRLRQYAENRVRDPLAMAVLQVQNESRIGIGFDHPVYVLNALARKEGAQPTALGALQIGLEYSKLAQDERAASWLKYAENLIANGSMKNAATNDVQWAGILHDQLAERRRFAMYKPPNIIRSGLFTVRCWPNDLNTVQLLAGLEAAQHTVYADFGVPMGNSEVVLWRSQSEFQSYTGRVSGTTTSEFIAALTLTRLVASQSGPVVLGEEINVFADPRANTVSTIAHEYGHVAVRHVSNGRTVPMWFNEGIATSVEGGYDNYIPRVRAAAEAGTLLTMPEMLEWDVDGERAFLAYSQANSMLDYIALKWGSNAIMEILRQIGRDVQPEVAFRNTLKMSTQELWTRWSQEGIQ
jgi:hypothetical protein